MGNSHTQPCKAHCTSCKHLSSLAHDSTWGAHLVRFMVTTVAAFVANWFGTIYICDQIGDKEKKCKDPTTTALTAVILTMITVFGAWLVYFIVDKVLTVNKETGYSECVPDTNICYGWKVFVPLFPIFVFIFALFGMVIASATIKKKCAECKEKS